jgi:hypothetical protein
MVKELGGRLTVRRQTLDLLIGVRIPASQPRSLPHVDLHMRILTFVLTALITSACLAQEPAELFEKAPPDVDAALRERITKFYDAYVTGKFREAYEMVAEDSKEIFFEAEKTRIQQFTIVSIKYSDNFTKATAVVACDRDFGSMGTRFKVKAPVGSQWKIENGEWRWFAIRSNEVMTPHGPMRPGPMPKDEELAKLTRAPRVPVLQRMVRPDKSSVRLSSTEVSSAQVTLKSALPGQASLEMDRSQLLPGLEVEFDRTDMEPQGSAVVSFRYTPSGKKPPKMKDVWIAVRPTEQVIRLRVLFDGQGPAPK